MHRNIGFILQDVSLSGFRFSYKARFYGYRFLYMDILLFDVQMTVHCDIFL